MTPLRSLVDLYVEAVRLRGTEGLSTSYLLAMKFQKVSVSAPHHLFFDETEKDNDIVGVGGWLATLDNWIIFERLWREALPPEADGDFHYVDFWNDPTHWAVKWSHKERLDLIFRLAKIIRELSSCGVGIIFRKTDFKNAVSEERRPPKMGPLQFSLGHCVVGLLELKGRLNPPPPSPWRVMFDHKLGYEGELATLYYGARAGFDKDQTFGNLSFGSRKEEPPLQAADLLMGEMLRRFQGQPSLVMDFLKEKKSMFLIYPTEKDFKLYIEMVIAARNAKSSQPE